MGRTPRISRWLNKIFREFASLTIRRFAIALTRVRAFFPLVSCLSLSSENQRHVAVNGIPIEGWTHDPSDEALLDLLPVLDSLRFTSDVRRVLGIRGYS